MKDEQIQQMMDFSYRTTLLLGMVTPLLMECKRRTPKAEHYKFDWFEEALQAVYYEGKPIPPFPEQELL